MVIVHQQESGFNKRSHAVEKSTKNEWEYQKG
jgi:hypothetical protein